MVALYSNIVAYATNFYRPRFDVDRCSHLLAMRDLSASRPLSGHWLSRQANPNGACCCRTLAVVPQPSPTSLNTTPTGALPRRGCALRAPNDIARCRQERSQKAVGHQRRVRQLRSSPFVFYVGTLKLRASSLIRATRRGSMPNP